jgi:hypothetical protein
MVSKEKLNFELLNLEHQLTYIFFIMLWIYFTRFDFILIKDVIINFYFNKEFSNVDLNSFSLS